MSDTSQFVAQRLRTEEGFRALPYKDSKGILTGGYGMNLTVPQPEPVWFAAMQATVDLLEPKLLQYPWYANTDMIRRIPLLDMAYNMGLEGLLHFPHMLSAVSNQDWQTAHDEMLNSQYAKDVGQRATKLAQILLTGQNDV